MAKKQASKPKAKKSKAPQVDSTKPGAVLPKLTSEMEKKYNDNKKDLDNFIKKALDKFDKYITGISILPPLPPKPTAPGQKPVEANPDELHIFILVDDSDVKKMSRNELIVRLTDISTKIAAEINKNFKPQVMLISELKEACYDAKYDIVSMVAHSGVLFDRGLLSALKVSEVHKNKVIRKFEKYVVSYIAVGSLFRGDSMPNDIDVAVVIDDTDVKKMSRYELRDKLRSIIINYGYDAGNETGVKADFHIQAYILTDFWENIKDANPVIFTMLRDGVPLYDRGVFMPWKLLLQMGRIKPSPEAIDMNMEVGDKLLARTKQKLLSVVGEDLFYAVMNPTQAALMLYGIPPPTPKEAVKLMDEIYVKKEKLLEKKYVDILEKIRQTFKDIEHKKLKEVSGADVDELIKDCKAYLDRIKKLFKAIEERGQKDTIAEIHSTCLNVTKDLLEELGAKGVSVAKLPDLFKKHVVDGEKVPLKYHKMLKDIIKAKKDYDAKKLAKQEVNKVRREAREYIRLVMNVLDRKRAKRLSVSKVQFRYGENKLGELILLEKVAFVVKDVAKRDSIMIGTLTKDGMIQNLKKSSVNEYEKYIKSMKLPHSRLIKPRMFEAVKDAVGEDVEIIWKG
tara:strand:- start:1017 stop:2885 length:1869 start_codon:yes stop_codon:yes gene_type:complete